MSYGVVGEDAEVRRERAEDSEGVLADDGVVEVNDAEVAYERWIQNRKQQTPFPFTRSQHPSMADRVGSLQLKSKSFTTNQLYITHSSFACFLFRCSFASTKTAC